MSRNNTISQLADELLARVEQDEQVKTASASYAKKDKLETPIGQQMLKVAGCLRASAEDTRVSYADLAEFRRRYDV